jgi:hypothetical protein
MRCWERQWNSVIWSKVSNIFLHKDWLFLPSFLTSHQNAKKKKKTCILYNQQDATYTTFFIIISALDV